MSVNKYQPHVMVLPEDRANHELAHGFSINVTATQRVFQVLPEAGGWSEVRKLFHEVHRLEMERNAFRHMVLLVDFDEEVDRLSEMKKVIPDSLSDRVFVIGVWSEPEELKRKKLGSRESIGSQLANECYEDQSNLWNHELLIHNASELDRMKVKLRRILFPPA